MSVREQFFEERSQEQVATGRQALHPGELWGVREVEVSEGERATSLRIMAERIMFQDYLLVRTMLDKPFVGLKKDRTYREWLGLDLDPREDFCPPRDALCVAVILVTTKPKPVLYVTKQKPRLADGRTPWDLSAVGAASSSQLHVVEERPDLGKQVQSVVLREIGVKFEPTAIHWLAFARSLSAGNSSVIALVESQLTSVQVENNFRTRRERDDVEQLLPIKVAEAIAWLEKVPESERGELLELGIALTAIRYRQATVG
jgi:hypothetical protein